MIGLLNLLLIMGLGCDCFEGIDFVEGFFFFVFLLVM